MRDARAEGDEGADRATTRRVVLAVAGLTLLAAVLRGIGLGAQSLWGDEAFTAALVALPFDELTHELAADVHPPLFYWLVKVATLLGRDEWQLRLVSMLAGVATLPMDFLLGRELFGARTGVVAAAIYAIAPAMIWYAQEARSYALFTLLFVTSSWLLVVALRRRRRRHLAGYALTLALTFYTHYFAGLALGAHVAVVFVLAVTREIGRAAVLRWVAATVAAILLTAPWWPALGMSSAARLNWIGELRAGDLAATFDFAWTGLLPASRFASVVALGCIGATLVRWQRRPRIGAGPRERGIGLITLATLVVVPIAGGVIATLWLRPIFVPRFFVAFMPPLYILAAHGIARQRAPVALGAAALLAGALALPTYRMLTSTTKIDWRGAIAYVERFARDDDTILMAPGWDESFAYYARTHTAVAIDDNLVGSRRMCRIAAASPQVWLLWSNFVAHGTATHAELAARWREVESFQIRGEINADYLVSRFETTTEGCTPARVPITGPACAHTFRLRVDDAWLVWVTGDFVSWAGPGDGAIWLARDRDGWSATVPVAAGPHQYRFIVNTDWILDPANPEQARGGDYVNSAFTCTPASEHPAGNTR